MSRALECREETEAQVPQTLGRCEDCRVYPRAVITASACDAVEMVVEREYTRVEEEESEGQSRRLIFQRHNV